MATRAERLMPNGVPRYIRCYDNGGETADRYTVVYTRTADYFYVGMSENPYHPQGFGQHGEGKDGPIDRPKYAHLGKRISFHDLPAECRKLVRSDYRLIWRLQ